MDLGNFTHAELARFWCRLNSFDWPKQLGDKPAGYGDHDDDKSGIAIMNEIQTIIGIKECLREWNKTRMTDEQFESWWDTNHQIKMPVRG